MTRDIFNKLIDELDASSKNVLKNKNALYGKKDDPLHNFKEGASIANCTPAQCCWGYLTKHLVALRDKVEYSDWSDRDDLLEKCQDSINYIYFIWLLANEAYADQIELDRIDQAFTGPDDNGIVGMATNPTKILEKFMRNQFNELSNINPYRKEDNNNA